MNADFDPDPVSGSILEVLVGHSHHHWVSLSDIQDLFAGTGVRVPDVLMHERADLLQSHGFVEKHVDAQSPTAVVTAIRLTREGAQVAASLYDDDEDEEE